MGRGPVASVALLMRRVAIGTGPVAGVVLLIAAGCCGGSPLAGVAGREMNKSLRDGELNRYTLSLGLAVEGPRLCWLREF